MSKRNSDEAYTEAVKSGLYAKKSGLVGKYDNVRLCWEDEVTREVIRPHLDKLLHHCRSESRRLKVMDLGCGSADGFELLMGIKEKNPNLHQQEVDLLKPEMLGRYKGVDLNNALLDQAAAIYGDNPKMFFEQGDFTKELPLDKDEEPYDLYFMSYGTSSHHNDDRTMVKMLSTIAERTKRYSIVVCDWLGRYSYEWWDLWVNDLSKNKNMDYVVSYIYDKEEREDRREELQHLTLRLMSSQEAGSIFEKASKRSGVKINPLVFFDRSVFTGRHMDTGEYNPNSKEIRKAVNSLHEESMRTDLSSLIIDYVPKPGFDFLNKYFENLQMCWNTLVKYVQQLCETYEENEMEFHPSPPKIPASYPEPLKDMMARMRMVVEGVGWLGHGMPRENIIEPQLGYALRHLITHMQQGQGAAHGLVVVLEIDKQ